MHELACIRIKVSDFDGARNSDHLRALVAKFTEYFLGQRWRLPRRHQLVAPGCFMLSDPRATHLDVNELNELAADLQYHLFGESASGSVQIFALWGEAAEVAEFSMLPEPLLERLPTRESGDNIAGRLVRIGARTPAEVAVAYRPIRERQTATEDGAAPAAPAALRASASDAPGFRGVYFSPKQAFFGSVLGVKAEIGGKRYDLMATARPPQEEDELEYDIITLRQAVSVMEQGGAPGILYVPISFRTAVTRMRLERIKPLLDRLSRFDKSRLACSLYSPPDAPQLGTLAMAYETLRSAASVVGLEAVSPDYPCPAMVTGCVRSITLVVTAKSPARRLADIDAFLDRLDEFKAAKVWAAVGNLQTKDELDLALNRRAPFAWGAAVTGLLSRPVRLDAVGGERLPVLAA
jgi:hypothetical protein